MAYSLGATFTYYLLSIPWTGRLKCALHRVAMGLAHAPERQPCRTEVENRAFATPVAQRPKEQSDNDDQGDTIRTEHSAGESHCLPRLRQAGARRAVGRQ